ncbi:hypothetical protein SteCoe_36312 [Stentor coeruleus]|uniref:Uncharacterized protein n=1 Tax=Stentor coeruleus TaxID=5963 RepID=A0A1R2AQF8_9CILI|nr:hypothetical protein SteCoe_36312 [Stentor coeruleus]
MEKLLFELSDIIRKEYKKINREVEAIQKLSLSRSYKCMANCFKSDSKFDDCHICAKLCKLSIQEIHDKFILKLDESQEYAGECFENCLNKQGKSSVKKDLNCLEECKDNSIKFMTQAKKACLDKLSRIVWDDESKACDEIKIIFDFR